MVKFITILLIVSFIYFVIVAIVSYLNLNKILTTRVDPYRDSPEKHGLVYEPVTFTASDGVKLFGWILPAHQPKGLVLLLHGFGVAKGGADSKPAGGKSGTLQEAEFLVKGGYSVFAFDLRLQGESDGKRITFGKDELKDVKAASDFINSRAELNKLPRGLMGVSFGGALAYLYAPSDDRIKTVNTTSAYADLGEQLSEEITASQFRWVPFINPISKLVFSWLLESSLENLSPINYVGRIQVPLLIAHGGKDERIPDTNAKSILQKANDPKTLLIEPNSNHGILDRDKGSNEQEDYKAKVLDFLNKNLSGAN